MYLRPYRRGDLPELYALDVRCFPPRFRFSRKMMREVTEAENALVALACDMEAGRERLLGFCAASLEEAPDELQHGNAQQSTEPLLETCGYIATLDVAPEHRRRGLGVTLLRWAETASQAEGAMHMLLHVWTGNSAAQRLYQQAGYEQLGERRDFYGHGFHALLYSKSLR